MRLYCYKRYDMKDFHWVRMTASLVSTKSMQLVKLKQRQENLLVYSLFFLSIGFEISLASFQLWRTFLQNSNSIISLSRQLSRENESAYFAPQWSQIFSMIYSLTIRLRGWLLPVPVSAANDLNRLLYFRIIYCTIFFANFTNIIWQD